MGTSQFLFTTPLVGVPMSHSSGHTFHDTGREVSHNRLAAVDAVPSLSDPSGNFRSAPSSHPFQCTFLGSGTSRKEFSHLPTKHIPNFDGLEEELSPSLLPPFSFAVYF